MNQQTAQAIRKKQAMLSEYKKMIVLAYPDICDESGIYVFTRDDGNLKYAYVGQSIHMLTRLAEHFLGYEQHIDKSLRAHKLYSSENPTGWKITTMPFPCTQLNEAEQYYISLYGKNGFQLRNYTLGGQGVGKKQIAEYRPPKGFKQGVTQGYTKACREIGVIIGKYTTGLHSAGGAVADRKTAELKELLEEAQNG